MFIGAHNIILYPNLSILVRLSFVIKDQTIIIVLRLIYISIKMS